MSRIRQTLRALAPLAALAAAPVGITLALTGLRYLEQRVEERTATLAEIDAAISTTLAAVEIGECDDDEDQGDEDQDDDGTTPTAVAAPAHQVATPPRPPATRCPYCAADYSRATPTQQVIHRVQHCPRRPAIPS